MKMMKKGILVLAIALLTFAMMGCSKETSVEEQKEAQKEAVSEAQNFGTPIEFEVISIDDLASNYKLQSDLMLPERGYFIWEGEDGFNYMLISMGEKPTGGYGLSVVSFGDYDGEKKILVAEGNPPKDSNVPQILTYPHVVIKYANDIEITSVLNEASEAYELIDVTEEK